MKIKQLIPFFTLYLAQGYPLGFLAVLLPLSAEKAGLSSTAIGVGMTLAMAPTFLKPFLAPSVDMSVSKKRTIIRVQCFMAMAAVCLFLLCFLFPQVWMAAFVGAIVFGALTAYQDVTTDGLAIQTLARQVKGTANAAMGLGMVSGASLGNSLAVHLSVNYGAGVSFISVGAVSALALISVKLFVSEGDKSNITSQKSDFSLYRRLLMSGFKSRDMRYAMVLMFLIGATSWSFGFIPLLFKNVLGMNESQVGGYISVVTLCSGLVGGILGTSILGLGWDKQIVILSTITVIILQFALGTAIYIEGTTPLNVGLLIGARHSITMVLFSGLYGFIMRFCSINAGSTEFAVTMAFSRIGTVLSATIGGVILEKGWVILLFSEACAMTLVIPVLWMTVIHEKAERSQYRREGAL